MIEDGVEMKFREVLKAALLAGFIAGGVASAFHWFLTEPVIDRAIEVEEQLSQAQDEKGEEPVVSRQAQRAGLILGFLLYGGAWGLLSGLFFHLTRKWQPETWSITKRGLVMVLVVGWSVAILPFLKYPANPPGVGDPETIGYRQGLYLGLIGLSFLGSCLTLWLQRSLAPKRLSSPTALALYVVFVALLYFGMPSNPDPVRMPAELVWRFQLLSLIGLLLFWCTLGGAFGWLCRRQGGAA